MPKNKTGGNKNKRFANKRAGAVAARTETATCDAHMYVCVAKVCGDGRFQVIDNDDNKYTAHVRGKMRGNNKRSNMISVFNLLLVGRREWMSDKSVVDVLCVYDDNDVQYLNSLPSVNIGRLVNFMNSRMMVSESSVVAAGVHDSGFDFSNTASVDDGNGNAAGASRRAAAAEEEADLYSADASMPTGTFDMADFSDI